MTLDLDNMTQAEFDEVMADLKENEPNLFQFIVDFINKNTKLLHVKIKNIVITHSINTNNPCSRWSIPFTVSSITITTLIKISANSIRSNSRPKRVLVP